jgi:hypothetical protein
MKNNLHDFQELCKDPLYPDREGTTKDRILDSLIFRIEDVKEFEVKHGKGKKETSEQKIPTASHKDEPVETGAEDFVRNLRVSFENDNEIRIQEPNEIAKCISCQSLGFRNNKAKAWNTFIEILQNSPHTYYIGPAYEYVQVYSDPDKIEGEKRKLKYSGKGERKKSYDRRYKRLREISTKIVPYLNDHYPVQIPSKYKLFEQCSDDNTFKFKFQVMSREEASNKDKVLGEFESCTEEYRETEDPSLLEKIHELALTILEREWLTNDEIKNAIQPVQSHDHNTDNERSRKPRLPTAE